MPHPLGFNCTASDSIRFSRDIFCAYHLGAPSSHPSIGVRTPASKPGLQKGRRPAESFAQATTYICIVILWARCGASLAYFLPSSELDSTSALGSAYRGLRSPRRARGWSSTRSQASGHWGMATRLALDHQPNDFHDLGYSQRRNLSSVPHSGSPPARC